MQYCSNTLRGLVLGELNILKEDDQKPSLNSLATSMPHYLVNHYIRAEMLSMTFKRHGPTTQDNQGEPNFSFSVQTPRVLG